MAIRKKFMKNIVIGFAFILFSTGVTAQVNWTNVDADFGPLPASMHV